ncbi:MAG TPA: VOC family protein [Chitinophagaceae bacterium]|jgi:catechol 2,3-dioxygenase-like lactoylglutathione lyase family enzyme|nr:VOC family protein [Chitinophagaceae bacterium]
MKISSIKETCIYITDIERTKEFYNTRLQLPVISIVPDRHIFFKAGASVLLCFIAAQTRKEMELPSHGASGCIHFAFEVEKEVYDETLNMVKKQEITILHEHVWKGGLRSFYFHDPDTNLVEVIEEGLWDRY